jgi:ketosteroid isomerase-like protein
MLSLVMFVVLGAPSAAAPPQSAASPVEATVRRLDDQERVAALHRDVPTLERLWSDQLVVNAPNNQVVNGKKAVLDTFVHSGIIDFASFERAIEYVRVDGDYVFLMGLETLVPKKDAPVAGLVAGRTITRRFTNIWRKEGDGYRLFARHANVMPPR